MSKKATFVSNKMDVRVLIGTEVVEHIMVHPNMVILPRAGDSYLLVNAQTEIAGAQRDVTRTMRTLMVIGVELTHGVARYRESGKVSTELLQQADIHCTESAPAQEAAQ